ncbi:hypothetical protein ACZ90_25535 [Streptomyces albus subsp. albus]|nr:hypothetical protein ACZ90_25535 [Streptomyces albus subsp. albus]
MIGSVQRALRLLEAVGAHRDGAPAKQLAREAGLPLPTAYHLLRTLTHEGYLRRENGVFLLPLTRYSVRDRATLLERLRTLRRGEPVIERQEYALGTVCAAIPVTAGATIAAMAISVPLEREDRLLPAVEQLRGEVASLLRSFVFSISI